MTERGTAPGWHGGASTVNLLLEILMERPVLFLDDGGVMNDNRVRGPQWQRLVGEFFVPRLGGTLAAWGAAHRVVAERLFARESWATRVAAAPDYATVRRSYWHDWLGEMCALVGVPAPAGDARVELARTANRFVTQRVRAAFPGAVAAIRLLHARRYRLHTASGESSTDLTAYLEGMDVRACFGTLYGPDVIDTFKGGLDYYLRMFADVGVDPRDAIVIDDTPSVLVWAARAGARTVLVSVGPPPGTTRPVIASLAELPALLRDRA